MDLQNFSMYIFGPTPDEMWTVDPNICPSFTMFHPIHLIHDLIIVLLLSWSYPVLSCLITVFLGFSRFSILAKCPMSVRQRWGTSLSMRKFSLAREETQPWQGWNPRPIESKTHPLQDWFGWVFEICLFFFFAILCEGSFIWMDWWFNWNQLLFSAVLSGKSSDVLLLMALA